MKGGVTQLFFALSFVKEINDVSNTSYKHFFIIRDWIDRQANVLTFLFEKAGLILHSQLCDHKELHF